MNNNMLAVLIFFLSVNLIAFFIMLHDKINSREKGLNRISEGMMFFLATAFGSLGIYAGMFAFRHKTRKWYFLLGIPLLILENSALLYVVYVLISG